MKATVWLMATIAAFSLTVYGASEVTTNSWTGGSGNWSEPNNWSLKRIPATSDFVELPDLGSDYTVTVDGDYTVSAVWFPATSSSSSAFTTLDGSGTITMTRSEVKILGYRNVVLAGATINHIGSDGFYLYGYASLDVQSGTLNTPRVYMHSSNSALMLNGGTVNATTGFNANNNSFNKHLVINSGTLKAASLSSYNDGTRDFECSVAGGVLEVGTLNLTKSCHTLRQTGGTIRITKSYDLANATLALTEGTIEVGYDFSDADINGLRSLSSGSKVIAPNARLTTTTTDCMTVTGVLETAGIYSKVNGGSFDLDTVVFTGGENKPFDFGGNKWNHTIYLQGPTILRTKADMNPDWTNPSWYSDTKTGVKVPVAGLLTFDTSDIEDPTANHVMFFEGIASHEGSGSLLAQGGGTVKMLTQNRIGRFASIEIAENTTVELLAKQSGMSILGHVKTESFTMGAGAKLKLIAGENFIEAADWSIDSTARITVTLPSDFTEGARAILRDMDSVNLPDDWLDRITLAGATEGAAIKNDHGQITVYKRASAADLGKYGEWEWTGAGADAQWKTKANWYGNGAMPEKVTAVFGSSSVTNSYFTGGLYRSEKSDYGGSTVGAIVFQTNAVDTFTIWGKQMTINKSPAVSSYSSVPQIMANNVRTTGTVTHGAYADAPIIFTDAFAYSADRYNTICGDIRFAYKNVKVPRINLDTAIGTSGGTTLTILPGATCTFTNQSTFYGGDCGFRVAEGGKLAVLTGGNYSTFQLTRAMAPHVINGTLDIQTPYVGGISQGPFRHVFCGSGRMNIASNQPSAVNTRVIFGDTLQVYYGASSWLTAKTDKDGCFAIGARGTPTLHVADGWSYGHGSETTTATVDKYQMTIEKGGVLSIDADGGEIAFTDPFVGPGAIALVNAKLALDGAFETTAGVRVDNGGILEITDDQTIGGLSANGGTLKVAADKTLTVAGDINAANLAFDGLTQTWRTYAVATGEITGTDAAKGARVQVVEADGVKYLQAKIANGGLLIIVR